MFDTGSAVVLGLVVLGLVQMAKKLIEGTNKERVTVAVCLVVAVVTVLLVAASDFAAEQVVLDRSLESLNFASQMVVALLLAGSAVSLYTIGVKAVSNIGQNAEKP